MSYHRTRSGVSFCINNCSYPMENVRQLALRDSKRLANIKPPLGTLFPWSHFVVFLFAYFRKTSRSSLSCFLGFFCMHIHRQPCNISTSSFTRTWISHSARTHRVGCLCPNSKQGQSTTHTSAFFALLFLGNSLWKSIPVRWSQFH